MTGECPAQAQTGGIQNSPDIANIIGSIEKTNFSGDKNKFHETTNWG